MPASLPAPISRRRALGLLVAAAGSVRAANAARRDLTPALEPLREKYRVPACGAAVVEGGRLIAFGATGRRRIDREIPVTPDDIWHIGSCTKSMTAALAGMLVDDGRLRWEMPLAAALPAASLHPDWQHVTLWHLITQRSGLAPMTRDQWRRIDAGPGSPREQRATFAQRQLAQPPTEPPGRFAYSNSGYGILGAILERAADQSYEDLLRERIFAPLALRTAGFGAPATPGQIDQPWGHYASDGQLTPAEPVPGNQFPPALAPAGSVHMSLQEFARYAWWLSSGTPALVRPATFSYLQTPPDGSSYAGGLWKTVLPGVGGEAVCHTGHIGGLFGVFHSGRDRACVSVFNCGGGGWEWLGEEIAATALRASA